MKVKPGNEFVVAILEYIDSQQTSEFLGFDKKVAQWTWITYQETARTRSPEEFVDQCVLAFWDDFPQDCELCAL